MVFWCNMPGCTSGRLILIKKMSRPAIIPALAFIAALFKAQGVHEILYVKTGQLIPPDPGNLMLYVHRLH